jgi:hypothetical protein
MDITALSDRIQRRCGLLVGVRRLTACIRSSTRPSSRRMDVINDTFEMALALATAAS